MSTWAWITEAILSALLIGTLVMVIRLDRALQIVRRDRAAFEALISSLGSATNAVKIGIQKLRDEAERAVEQIDRRSEAADRMATDLSFLIEQAERAGGRLEGGLREIAGITTRGRAARGHLDPAHSDRPGATGSNSGVRNVPSDELDTNATKLAS